MGFLDRLFGAGGSQSADAGLHIYVKSGYADEIVDVRIDPHHDLVEEYEGEGDGVSHYTAHRDVIGQKDFRIISAYLIFDRNRAFTGDASVENGELVDRAAYDAWKAREAAARAVDEDAGD